jgi:hypothetical protein
MDEDAEMACWHQLQHEQEQLELAQQLLKQDPAYEQWLIQLELEHESQRYDIRSTGALEL